MTPTDDSFQLPTVTLDLADGVTEQTFLATVTSQIPYVEFLNADVSIAPRQMSATRYVACLWDDQRQFLIDMLGTTEVEAGATAGGVTTNLRRYPPEPHP